MKTIKKAYNLFFYKLYRFFTSISVDGWEDWKALLVIGVLEGFLLIELYTWSGIIFRDKNIQFSNTRGVSILLGLFIAVSNYYILLHKNRWKQYEEEFKNYSTERNRLINFSVFLFILLVIGSVIFAFYQMSLIDWSQYRNK